MFGLRIKIQAKRTYSELLNTIVNLEKSQLDKSDEQFVTEIIRLCTGDYSFASAKMAGYAKGYAAGHKRGLTLADIVYGILVQREGIFDGAILNMSRKNERASDAIEKAVESLPKDTFVEIIGQMKKVK